MSNAELDYPNRNIVGEVKYKTHCMCQLAPTGIVKCDV